MADSLLGPGLTRVGDATLIGVDGQQGSFSTTGGGSQGVVGFTNGVLLTTGLASSAVDPNTGSGFADADANTNHGNGGAPPFDNLFDANVLEFSFIVAPGISDLRFSYVFASEEYEEFVGQFNDQFGFYINGVNVAVLPDSSPVSINTVNLDTNSTLYRSNVFPSSAINTRYDGLTTVLTTADMTPFLNGGTNTLRIIVADDVDGSLDTAVFLQAGSFTQGGGVQSAAPEPSALALLVAAIPVIGIVRRRRTR